MPHITERFVKQILNERDISMYLAKLVYLNINKFISFHNRSGGETRLRLAV